MNPVCLTLILMETVLLFRINLSNGYVPHLLPVPDMTALVTLRDKPLGGNDSMPMVHVRCQGIACNPSIDFTLTSETFCKKMSSCIAVKINQQDLWISGFPDPDMTTLVTLEVQSPGDNDSVSLVQVRIRFYFHCGFYFGFYLYFSSYPCFYFYLFSNLILKACFDPLSEGLLRCFVIGTGLALNLCYACLTLECEKIN